MNKERKAALSAGMLVIGMCALALFAGSKVEMEAVPDLEEVVPVVEEPLNGVFLCEYYKNKTQSVLSVANYEVFPEGGNWMWTLHLHDDTSMFFVQTPGQFCYVHHVGDGE